MSATYEPDLTNDLFWVRFKIGDRDVSANEAGVRVATLQDEEIVGLLAEESNKYLAAAAAARLMMSSHGDLVSKKVDDLSLTFSDSPEGAYTRLADHLYQKGIQIKLGRTHAFKAH